MSDDDTTIIKSVTELEKNDIPFTTFTKKKNVIKYSFWTRNASNENRKFCKFNYNCKHHNTENEESHCESFFHVNPKHEENDKRRYCSFDLDQSSECLCLKSHLLQHNLEFYHDKEYYMCHIVPILNKKPARMQSVKQNITNPTILRPPISKLEVKAPEVKTEVKTEVKAPEVKTEVKAPEIKAPEVKAPEIKAPEVKAHEAAVKAPEVKAHEAAVKAPEVPLEIVAGVKHKVKPDVAKIDLSNLNSEDQLLNMVRFMIQSPMQSPNQSSKNTTRSTLKIILNIPDIVKIIKQYPNYIEFKNGIFKFDTNGILKSENQIYDDFINTLIYSETCKLFTS